MEIQTDMEVFRAIPLHPLGGLALSVSLTLVILLCAIPHSTEHQRELNKRMIKNVPWLPW